jgi:hypothetical protein
VPEDDAETCRYGIVKNLGTFNPVHIAFHEWAGIVHDVRAAGNWRERLGYVFGPPGWKPDGSGATSEAIRAAWRARASAAGVPSPTRVP